MPIALGDLPAELLLDIFNDACTDAGQTGCALSLVSKDFRAFCLSNGVDIHSAAVYGLEGMERFVKMLETREESTRKVEHLFLTDRVRRNEGWRPGDTSFNPDSFNSSETKATRLNRVLRAISPLHLKSLTIIMPRHRLTPAAEPSAFSSRFESLAELTLYIGADPKLFAAFHPTPSLKRLNIASSYALPCDIGSALSRFAPNLTHLRIAMPNPSGSSRDITNVLRSYVKTSSPPTVLSKPPHAFGIGFMVPDDFHTDIISQVVVLPSNVHTVIIAIETLFLTESARLGASRRRMYWEAVHDLQEIVPKDPPSNQVTKRLILRDPPTPKGQEEQRNVSREIFESLRDEWQERILGGEGCWKIS